MKKNGGDKTKANGKKKKNNIKIIMADKSVFAGSSIYLRSILASS